MCLSPILIKNPNRGLNDPLKDCVSYYIPIPCGHCKECVSIKQIGYVQRVQLESISSYVFFCTLTYQDSMMPYYDIDDLHIRYADISDVQNMIKRLRKNNSFGRPFRYFAVSELGSKKSRPHFHILWFLRKYDSDDCFTPSNLEDVLNNVVFNNWVRNVGSNKYPIYKPLSKYVAKYYAGRLHSTYDLHYVVPSSLNGSSNDVSFYVTKYLLKNTGNVASLRSYLKSNLSPEDYESTWKLVKPRVFYSLNFGFGLYDYQAKKVSKFERLEKLCQTEQFKIVRNCIDRSLITQDKPRFFDIDTGKPLPLSRYFYKFGDLYRLDDALVFNSRSDCLDGNVIVDDRPLNVKLALDSKFKSDVSKVENRSNIFDYLNS